MFRITLFSTSRAWLLQAAGEGVSFAVAWGGSPAISLATIGGGVRRQCPPRHTQPAAIAHATIATIVVAVRRYFIAPRPP